MIHFTQQEKAFLVKKDKFTDYFSVYIILTTHNGNKQMVTIKCQHREE